MTPLSTNRAATSLALPHPGASACTDTCPNIKRKTPATASSKTRSSPASQTPCTTPNRAPRVILTARYLARWLFPPNPPPRRWWGVGGGPPGPGTSWRDKPHQAKSNRSTTMENNRTRRLIANFNAGRIRKPDGAAPYPMSRRWRCEHARKAKSYHAG